ALMSRCRTSSAPSAIATPSGTPGWCWCPNVMLAWVLGDLHRVDGLKQVLAVIDLVDEVASVEQWKAPLGCRCHTLLVRSGGAVAGRVTGVRRGGQVRWASRSPRWVTVAAAQARPPSASVTRPAL